MISKEKQEQIGREIIELMPGTAFVMIVFDFNNPAANRTIANVKDELAAQVVDIVAKKLNPNNESL